MTRRSGQNTDGWMVTAYQDPKGGSNPYTVIVYRPHLSSSRIFRYANEAQATAAWLLAMSGIMPAPTYEQGRTAA